MDVTTLRNSVVRRTDMSFNRTVTLIENLLIADIGTVSVKERHAQNMYNEAKKRIKLTRWNYVFKETS